VAPEIQVPQLHLLAKPSLLHHANLAQLDLPAHLEALASPVAPDKTDNPDKEVETQLPDPLDQKDPPDNPETPEDLDNPETQEPQLNLKEPPLAHLDQLETMVPLDNPEDPDNPEAMGNPEDLDPRDHLAHPETPDNPEAMDNPETLDNLVDPETRVSAPNTAPSMVESSSKMEPGDKQHITQDFRRTIILFFGCTIIFSKI